MARDEQGRWQKGTSGNPNGRPRREVEQAYQTALIGVVSIEHWRQIVTRAVDDARLGNAEARRFIADYLLGRPTQRQEIVQLPQDEIEKLSDDELEAIVRGEW